MENAEKCHGQKQLPRWSIVFGETFLCNALLPAYVARRQRVSTSESELSGVDAKLSFLHSFALAGAAESFGGS